MNPAGTPTKPPAEWVTQAWPTAPKNALLKGLFHRDPDVARASWETWEKQTDFDDIRFSDMRLLPAAPRRLKTLGITSANADRIQGLRRYSWAQTQLVIARARHLLGALNAAGIPVMIIKGAARALSDWPRHNERHIGDVDILIRHRDLQAALAVFRQSDWRCGWDQNDAELLNLLHGLRHSVPFLDNKIPERSEVDLHTCALFMNRAFMLDDELWHRSRPASTKGFPVSIPSPADHLFIACSHGQLYEPHDRPFDWVADAADIFATGQPTTNSAFWDQVIADATKRSLIPGIYSALTYLNQELALPVPEAVLQRLARACTEPFISEFSSYLGTWNPQTIHDRQAWGAATLARAAHLGHCQIKPDKSRPTFEENPSASTKPQEAQRADNHRFPIPLATARRLLADRSSAPPAPISLAIDIAPLIAPDTTAARSSVDMVLIAGGDNLIELDRRNIPIARSKSSGPKKVIFKIDSTLLTRTLIDTLYLEQTAPNATDIITSSGDQISYRWYVSEACRDRIWRWIKDRTSAFVPRRKGNQKHQ